jgi:SWI/SNF-related matrix-associated actin-dependent regulator of chromatin subfamily A-like protein 1
MNAPTLKANSFGVFEVHNPSKDLEPKLVEWGFVIDKTTKLYSTRKPSVAYKASQYADFRTELALQRMSATKTASWSTTSETKLRTLPSGFSYLPYQIAGIEFLKEHKKVLLADEPGSGKTLMSIGLINECPDVWNVLILCPASLRLNWEQEISKFLIDDIGKIEVVSYDSAWREQNFSRLSSENWDLIVMDEAQYVKDGKSKRSMAAQSLATSVPRVILLTGTPVDNKPSDLFPLLHTLRPKMFPDFTQFAIRYCGAFLQEITVRGRTKKVWNTSGSSNEEELQDILRSTLMIRRLKKDVLPQLPKKIRQIIEIENNEKAVKAEDKAWKSVCDEIGYDEALKQLEEGVGVAFASMAGARKDVALVKVPYVLDFVENLLKSIDKIVLFAHHKDVVAALMEGLKDYSPVKLVGGMSDKDKNDSVVRFQNDKEVRVFIGNIKAAGVGLTLTASSTVVFAELCSVPAAMTQCEDRVARIGATADSVLVYHLVLNGSLDVKMARKLIEKQSTADKILDV